MSTSNSKVIKKTLAKAIFKLVIGVFIFFGLMAGAIQIPVIQTKIVKELSETVSRNIQFPVNIEHVDLNWFDELRVKRIRILDRENNPMILIDDLLIDFDIGALVSADRIRLDAATLTQANIVLTKYSIDQEINIGEFIKSIKNWVNPKDKPAKRDFTIGKVFLVESKVSMNNIDKDSIHNGLDYHHFVLDSLSSEIRNLKIRNDTVRLMLMRMEAVEPVTRLSVHDFTTNFYFNSNVMAFRDLHLAFGKSELKDSLVFNYGHPSAMSSFTDSVVVAANFERTFIDAGDLKLFVPNLKQTNQQYVLSGDFYGRVKSFNFSNVQLEFGHNSRLMGNVNLEGLPAFLETFIDASLQNSVVDPGDLRPFIGDKLFSELRKFGTIRLNSQFLGFPRDFVANGVFFTRLGTMISDINFKIDPQTQSANYSGSLATDNFDLGGWTNDPETFQNVALKGQIKGSGFTIEGADFELKADITKFGFKKYNYTNIQTDARLAKELFIGKLKIDDPNLKFTSNAFIDLRENVDHIAVEATLDTANLKPLNLLDKEATLRTYVDLDFTGLTLDEIVGFANFRNTRFTYEDNRLEIDRMAIISQKKVDERRINIDSDRFEINAQGDFEFSNLFQDLQHLIHEYRLNLVNDQQAITQYYRNKPRRAYEKYHIDFKALLKDANPFLALLVPELKFSANTPIDGYFRHGFNSILAVNSTIDTLQYKNNLLYGAVLDFNTSKISDSTNVLAMAYFSSDEQEIGTLATTRDLFFEAIWSDDHIDFNSRIEVKDYDGNRANVSGQLEFKNDRTLLTFDRSDFSALNQKWQLAPDNRISISDREFEFRSLTLFNKEQSITVNGFISPDSSKKLLVEFNRFKVENLNPLLSYNLHGELNADIEFRNLYGDPLINSGLTVTDFRMGKFLVGDILGKSYWNNSGKYFDLSLAAIRDQSKVLDIKGIYTPKAGDEELNLQARFNQTNLNLLEPFIGKTFSQIQGFLDGEVAIRGALRSPKLNGTAQISQAQFLVNYLHTVYRYHGGVNFTENSITVANQFLQDANGNRARINGGLIHNGFKELQLDLSGQLSNFMVLNTTDKDNDLYYGTAIVTGDIRFDGPLSNFFVKASATSEKGTRIFIPINDFTDVEQRDFINFVSFGDTVNTDTQDSDVRKVDLAGINMDFDLDITPDAYMEIIFDLKAGDIIRGRGNGQLNLLIDTQGDFNMFGEYTIQEGGYNFTLYNIINKEFNILPTSRISWYGDPYEGILDIQATYEQTADVSPLFASEQENPTGRRYPAIVLLDLEGNLLSPQIEFDIYLKDNQIVDPEITRKIQEIKNDEQALKRQVFSLIVLRQFSPPDDLSLGSGNPLGGSVSELLSNQLSYWFSQVDENLEIDVDLNGLDQEALNTFQLRLSYTFLDGRLRITREGGFTNTVENRNDFSSIAGDWTLEYLLSSDGKFRAKMYNRNTYNTLNSGLEDINTTSAGFSLIHTQTFNTLNDLFSQKKDKKKNDQDVSLNTDVAEEPPNGDLE